MGIDKRKEDRKHVEDGVLYLHEVQTLDTAAQNGLAFDLSGGGACIYSQRKFEEDDMIKVFCVKFGDKPMMARVRWSKKVDDKLYKIGLSFDENND
jgi:hypothetical protein